LGGNVESAGPGARKRKDPTLVHQEYSDEEDREGSDDGILTDMKSAGDDNFTPEEKTVREEEFRKVKINNYMKSFLGDNIDENTQISLSDWISRILKTPPEKLPTGS
jgi:hypothetical protein